jgi:predicted small secreted protein
MRKFFAATLPVLLLAVPLVACSEGPAERTGKRLDNAGAAIRDTVDPPRGPVERAGRSIDRALD